jgi:hypothetical protein
MALFKNFIIAVIIVGVITRIAITAFSKKIKTDVSIYISYLTSALLLLPIVSLTLGFDIAISEYLVGIAIWLLFDLIRIKASAK